MTLGEIHSVRISERDSRTRQKLLERSERRRCREVPFAPSQPADLFRSSGEAHIRNLQ